MKKLLAEFIGTFTLVFGGCGSAILAAGYPDLGIGFTGVALAFGLSLMVMIYAFGSISGGHFNPAVTFGLCLAKKFPIKKTAILLAFTITGWHHCRFLHFLHRI